MNTKSILWALSLTAVALSSCDKMIETPPPNEILIDDAVKNAEDLQMLLNSSYNELANTFGGFGQVLAELQSDNLTLPNNNDYREVFNHNVLFFNSTTGAFHSIVYRTIFRANFVEKYLDRAADLTEADRTRIVGEIAFIRAYCHFWAVRMFAQPYGFTADNSHPGIAIANRVSTDPYPRSTVAEAYAAIISDAETAMANLPADNGYYADKQAAQALLAQVYFQMGEYSQAADMATQVIGSGRYTLSDTVNLFNSKAESEYIFRIVSTGVNDNRSGAYNGNYAPGTPTCQMDLALYNAVKDPNDKRCAMLTEVNAGAANMFVKSSAFDGQFFDVPLFYLTQMHLIRAEALALSGGDLTTAIMDVNNLVARAYTDPSSEYLASSASANEVLTKVRAERRMELLFQGDRIQEVKRLGAIEGQNLFIRGHRWDCDGMVLQFPIVERTSIFEINPTGGCK